MRAPVGLRDGSRGERRPSAAPPRPSARRRRAVAAAILYALAMGPGAAPAQGDAPAIAGEPGAYRLAVGDTVEARMLGEAEGWSGRIDIDGAVRLPGLGQAAVEGLSLAEAEARLEAAVGASGLYVAPEVSVALVAHAPVLVTGDVRNPGAFEFVPHLTAAAAAGLAGGVALSGADTLQLALLAPQLAGDLRRLETEIQQAVLRIARLDAQIEGRAEIAPDDPALDVPLASVGGDLARHLLEVEGAILREEAQASEEILGLWRAERDEIENQITLLANRLEVQGDLIRLQAEEMAAAEELDARGLRTRADMARVERLDADARARLLEIEASLSQARSRRSAISRAIAEYGLARRTGFLEASAREEAALERLFHERRTTIEKQVALGDGAAAALAAEAVAIGYSVRRRQAGVVRTMEAGPDTELRPGDALSVSIAVPPAGTVVGATN